jgi:threonine synthase
MEYQSTRGSKQFQNSAQAIIRGIAEDKGLYVPIWCPRLNTKPEQLADLEYKEIAYRVMSLFFNDYSEEELRACVENAYDEKFDAPEIVPLHRVNNAWFLELYHGRTAAFKDMALSILPHLLTTAMKKENEDKKIAILTATSGDTGKAALEGFADVPGTEIIVFFPEDGVSQVQKQQMISQQGANTHVFGIHGNFDDAQTEVKQIFNNKAFAEELAAKGYRLSSANSINIGRLVPQIVYYVYSYATLLREGRIKDGDEINIVVPTGNFGNILAAYYARAMGLPVKTLICASNENRVLYDFFGTGAYDRNREFILTSSPSMDILISSNLERLIYHIAGDDADKDRELMAKLLSQGRYEITPSMREQLTMFHGGFATEEETLAEIGRVYRQAHYLIDTHTAGASAVYAAYREKTGDATPTVIASTASPFKFPRAVAQAIDVPADGDDDLALAAKLAEVTGRTLPKAVRELSSAPVRHTGICAIDGMEQAVKGFLKI